MNPFRRRFRRDPFWLAIFAVVWLAILIAALLKK